VKKEEKAALRALLEREAIRDCVHRYTRGIDRLDEGLLLSAYHDDGLDDHGTARFDFVGSARELYDAAKGMTQLQTSLHYVTNHVSEIEGDEAHAETYYLAMLRVEDGGHDVIRLGGGRYLDRLERREGEWRIVDRVATGEWTTTLEPDAPPEAAAHPPRRDDSDLSYARPLTVRGRT
jgi:hypothetical protein